MARVGRPASCDCDQCPKCKQRIYMRKWYASKTPEVRRAMRARRDIERVREYDRRRPHRVNPDYQDDPVKRAARVRLGNAVKYGKVQKQPCARCGAAKVHAHHPDYSQPLEVLWLCPVHHSEAHKDAA